MNVGIGVIQMAQYVKERAELTRIASEQERNGKPLSLQAYHDIVEYQRFVSVRFLKFLLAQTFLSPGLYSQEINVIAWRLLLIEIYRDHISEVLAALFQPQITRGDVQTLIQQLAACALTNW